MMKVDLHEVEHVATLARIELGEDEREGHSETLSSILEFFDRLKEVDTEGVPPTAHVLDLTNALRPDRCEPSLDVDDTLNNAPDRAERFFRVPKIID
jgi:aspartyl-tRNA(Asn)/glutamyl-tRNA(Gln) amidotransferase subunit C